ncbi:PDZ domain-containing protein [Persephonella sp.]
MIKILTKLNVEKITFVLFITVLGVSLGVVISSYVEMKFFTLPEVTDQQDANVKLKRENLRSYNEIAYIFETKKISESVPAVVDNQKRKNLTEPIRSVKNIDLVGVIDFNGKKIALVKTKKGTEFVRQNDHLAGYRVVKIEDFSLVLEREGKSYKLSVNPGSNLVKDTKVYKGKNVENKSQKSNESEVIRIDRRFIEEKTADIGTLLKDVLIVPVIKDNETIGFRFKYVKPQSLLYKFGLRSGDLIVSINDMPVRTAEEAFKIYNMLRNEQFIKLVIERNGKRKVLTYEIR